MTFERSMLEIIQADRYRYNVTIDSAGVIYNIVELVNPE